MCLILIALDQHPALPLIVAANRDVLHKIGVTGGNHEYYANGILVSNCHAQIYQRIALSRQLGASMGIGFVEPLTKEKPKADYINSEGKLVTDLSEQIEEALSGDNISTDWRYS